MKKNWNKRLRDYETVLARLRDYGLAVYGTFIFGYDHDTRESFEVTLDFAIRQKLFFAAFNHLVPFPGTPLYRSLLEQGRLMEEKWWLNPDYRFGEVGTMFFAQNLLARQEVKNRQGLPLGSGN